MRAVPSVLTTWWLKPQHDWRLPLHWQHLFSRNGWFPNTFPSDEVQFSGLGGHQLQPANVIKCCRGTANEWHFGANVICFDWHYYEISVMWSIVAILHTAVPRSSSCHIADGCTLSRHSCILLRPTRWHKLPSKTRRCSFAHIPSNNAVTPAGCWFEVVHDNIFKAVSKPRKSTVEDEHALLAIYCMRW